MEDTMRKGNGRGRFLSALAAGLLAGCTGESGSTTLVKTTNEPAGMNCAAGGVKIEEGVDTNRNGVLDSGEVDGSATRYVCNGSSGTALVKTSPEPAGANCASGGTRIDSGIDANGNGVLDPSEINAAATTYVCNGTPGPSASSTGLVVAIQGVTQDPAGPVSVHFTMRDARGFPVDKKGVYTINTPIAMRFSLAYVTQDSDGNVLPYTVYTQSSSASAPTTFQPTAYNPDPASTATAKTPALGTLVEDVPLSGQYTYTFPASDVAQTDAAGSPNGAVYRGVTLDAAQLGASHALWIEASRQTNLENPLDPSGYTATNTVYNFVPSGSGAPIDREIAATSGCNNCHRGFSAEGLTSDSFHNSGRIDARYCDICHNPGRTSNPSAVSSVFVHRIHAGEMLQPANVFHGIAATYPQDIRNCKACHEGAAQGAQAEMHPTLAACTSCHDQVDFTAGSSLPACVHPPALDATTGLPQLCKHTGGAVAEPSCVVCHTAALIDSYHVPIAPPDPNNILNGGTNANTNAAFLAAAGAVPEGAATITYAIQSVDVVADAMSVKRLSIQFKLMKNGADVVFPTFGSGPTELMTGFVGSPSVYFAFSVPEDGIATPADYNVTASGYIKNIWNGSASGLGAGTLTGPDSSGFYTIVLGNVVVPDSATQVTGGVGYTYSLATSFPLTEIDLPAFPYDPVNKQGGLIVPAPDVFKVATGYTGRHIIIDNNNCLKCHVELGAAPTFHAGQRNNGPTCSFCHNPNQSTSGWSGNAKDFIHAIHGARKRTVPFTWHAESPTDNFSDVEFPGPLNNCTACHVAGDNDFSNPASLAAVPNMLFSTVAKGRYDSSPTTNPNGYFTISPYVVADGFTDYGLGFSTSNLTTTLPDGREGTQGGTDCTPDRPCTCSLASPCSVAGVTSGKQGSTACTADAPCTCTSAAPCTGVAAKTCTTTDPCDADPTTLVKSPITAACSACHDSPTDVDHFRLMGGFFYASRSAVMAAGTSTEQCLLCHGPGRIAAIADVHK
jgi:OmcA/MtrC family decaheme c-type cytochrome